MAFWVNEENGGRGGVAYREWVGDKIRQQVAAIEMDGGAEAPRGFGAGVDDRSMALLQQIGKLLERVGAGEITGGGGGSDIGPLMRDGVPGLGERTTGAHYFDWHHTEADTLDKVDPEDFRKNLASSRGNGLCAGRYAGDIEGSPDGRPARSAAVGGSFGLSGREACPTQPILEDR